MKKWRNLQSGEIREAEASPGDGWELVTEAAPEERVLSRLNEMETERTEEVKSIKDEIATIRTAVEEIGIKTAKVAAEPKEHRKIDMGCLIHSLVTGDWSMSEFEKSIVTGDEARALDRLHQRDMSVGVDSAGGFLVPTAYLPERFIEKMQNATVVREAGAQTLDNLTSSPVVIPKMTTDVTAYWIAEGGAPTESTPAPALAPAPRDATYQSSPKGS